MKEEPRSWHAEARVCRCLHSPATTEPAVPAAPGSSLAGPAPSGGMQGEDVNGVVTAPFSTSRRAMEASSRSPMNGRGWRCASSSFSSAPAKA